VDDVTGSAAQSTSTSEITTRVDDVTVAPRRSAVAAAHTEQGASDSLVCDDEHGTAQSLQLQDQRLHPLDDVEVALATTCSSAVRTEERDSSHFSAPAATGVCACGCE
jgi:hypothetical protein